MGMAQLFLKIDRDQGGNATLTIVGAGSSEERMRFYRLPDPRAR
jgi:hypothetical protein